MKKIFYYLCPMLFLIATSVSCNKEDATMDFLLNVRSSVEVQEGTVIKTTIIQKRGPKATDKVYLKALTGGASYTYDINEVQPDYFTFTIGAGFKEGSYSFNIKRGDNIKYITDVNYTIKADTPEGIGADATIYGTITCEGQPVQGVEVSDGFEVVTTDEKGVYQIESEKKAKYVFITVPSGYEVECDGIQAKFYKYTTKASTTLEQIDFQLYEAGDQTNHTMLLLPDMHLAGGKQNDRTQFAKVTSELNAYISNHPSDKIYAITLGDMTWDCYWYSRSYCFQEYLADMNVVKNLPIFHTIGNHDNNMKTSVNGATAGWNAVDWDTAEKFREDLGPTYYSINIGQIHYIILDNIYCTNTTGGTADDRDYDEKINDDNLKWLKKDLQYVSKTTPIVVCMHAPLYNQTGSATLINNDLLLAALSGYSEVRFITGHTHKMWTVDSGNFHEHNSGAICGAWWWAGYYCPNLNIAQDGAPSGYRIMDVKGTELPSYFKGTGRDADYQFRTYDLNETYMPASQIPNITDYGSYNTKSTKNEVLINVWDYNKDWTVTVTENGNNLTVSQVTVYDPLYILTYIGNRYKTYSSSIKFGPFKTNHMFKVTASSATSTLEIKVTDDEGRVYTETMERPKAFTTSQYE